MSLPFVSVIVPVFNDAERLRTCLRALESQTYSSSKYEVIVVDNGSDCGIEDLTREYAHSKAVREDRPGSYAARNGGIAQAAGEVIAFTDSDCVPAPRWIEMGVAKLLEVPNCGLVAGNIQIFCKNQNRPTAVEIYESVTAFPQKRYVDEYHYGATANLFTYRKVLEHVGPFDANLKSSGDNEWGNRVFRAGYALAYADGACISHPARSTFAEIYRKVARLTGGRSDLAGQRCFPFMSVIRAVRPPVGLLCRAWRDSRLRGGAEKLKFVWVEMFVRYVRAFEQTRLYLGLPSRR